jgi:hypothetical protein
MNHMLIPPREPANAEPVRPPMIYIEKQARWEYKQVIRNLENEKPLDETELNALGKDGWEMTGIVQQPPNTYFYFKRQTEK